MLFRAINYRTEDFLEVVRVETAGKGVDVILDMVAGKYLSKNIDSLADDGRLVVIALLGGAKAELRPIASVASPLACDWVNFAPALD